MSVGDGWSVPVTNNGEGMNMAKWVGIWEEWMNHMLAAGFQIDDLPKIAAQHGEQFPKSLIATAKSKNTLFPSANMLFEYDLDNKMKRSYPHNSLEGQKGPGEWVPMSPEEIKSANDYYAWRENPKNFDWIDNKFGGNAYNAYLSAGNGYRVQGPLGANAKVSNGAARGATGSISGSGVAGPYGSGSGQQTSLLSELGRSMRLDSLTQQYNLEKSAREYGEGVPIQDYLTDFYGDILGVSFDRQPYSLSSYLNGGVGNTTSTSGVGTTEQNGPVSSGHPVGPDGRHGTPQDPIYEWDPNTGKITPVGTSPSWTSPITPDGKPVKTGGGGDLSSSSTGDHAVPRNPVVIVDQNGNTVKPKPNPAVPGAGAGSINHAAGTSLKANTEAALSNQLGTAIPIGNFPQVPIPQNNYHLSGAGNYNPNNPTSWSMLGQPASEIAADKDAQIAQINRALPKGGERNLAAARAMNQGYGNLASLRQNLVGKSLDSLGSIAQSKMFGTPVQPGSTAQSLLSSYNQQDATNKSYALGKESNQIEKTKAYNQLVAGLFSGVGGILASDPKVKTDVKKHDGSLEKVKQLEPVDYTYTSKVSEYGGRAAGKPGQKATGVMADKTKKVMPEAVGEDPSGLSTIDPMEILMNVVDAIKDLDLKVSSLMRGRK